MIPTVSFIGWANSGKTSLLVNVVSRLKTEGYRVAVVKHAHKGFDIDHNKKDSWRLSQAGSDIVALSSPEKLAIFERLDKELTLTQLRTILNGKADIILTEGYKNEDAPKILVLISEEDELTLCQGEKPLAVILSHQTPQGIPQFNEDDIDQIVKLLTSQIWQDLAANILNDSNLSELDSEYSSYQSLEFEELLNESASLHGHICPGQVLGVRMAMRGCQELGIGKPKEQPKRMIVYVEIDRCATDAIQAVIGCKLGKRTMKFIDHGKLAATFVDLITDKAVRIAVREDSREKAELYGCEGWTKQDAEIAAYKELPDEELFSVEEVWVEISEDDMPGPPKRRVICDKCGEGVNDGRDIISDGMVLCHACAYGTYYKSVALNVV